MPSPRRRINKPVNCDDQHKFQTEVGYAAARQKAIELAMVVDEDCSELGIERSPTGVASWNDDRRPPLYWAGSKPFPLTAEPF